MECSWVKVACSPSAPMGFLFFRFLSLKSRVLAQLEAPTHPRMGLWVNGISAWWGSTFLPRTWKPSQRWAFTQAAAAIRTKCWLTGEGWVDRNHITRRDKGQASEKDGLSVHDHNFWRQPRNPIWGGSNFTHQVHLQDLELTTPLHRAKAQLMTSWTVS